MAELEDAPWAVKKQDAKGHPAAAHLEDAPWAAEKPGVLEDVAKTAGPDLLRGTLAAITTPRAISDLTGAGVNYVANKLPEPIPTYANKFHNLDTGVGQAFPSYEETKSGIEKEITGPLAEPKTGVGKGVQAGLEVLPALAAGGEGVLPTIGRAIGSGTLSGLMGSGLDYLKEKFPSIPDWVPKVGRAGGAMVGGAVAPRAVTPLPMSDKQLAVTTALEATNPELKAASSAGQWTGSPRMAALEARSPRMADVTGAQEGAYTQGVMRQAGSNGMFDTAGLAEAKNTGAQLEALRNAHRMSPPEFTALNQDVHRMSRPGSDLYKAVGPSKAFNDVRDQIRLGPTGGNPMPLDMTGQRYGALRQVMQNASESAPTTHEQIALVNARKRMDEAFHGSMPADEAERLRQLNQQYSNYKTIENIPVKPGENTITPAQVSSKAERGSPLDVHAEQATSVMKPLPTPNTEGGFGTKLVGGTLGALGAVGAGMAHGSGLAGAAEAPFLSYYGFNHLNDVVQAMKNGAGRVAASPPVQAWAKNQVWRPESYTSAPNKEALIRLLMSPQSQLPPTFSGGGT